LKFFILALNELLPLPVYLLPLVDLGWAFGEASRLRCINGERFGDLDMLMASCSFSGDGDEPAVAELRRDDELRHEVSKWRNRMMGPSSELLSRNAKGQLIQELLELKLRKNVL
jgi:hypothetical protein